MMMLWPQLLTLMVPLHVVIKSTVLLNAKEQILKVADTCAEFDIILHILEDKPSHRPVAKILRRTYGKIRCVNSPPPLSSPVPSEPQTLAHGSGCGPFRVLAQGLGKPVVRGA